mmetsp:Transcript_4604/g.8965  ORF Transcript_4604/g.8965 Transcript_4604/m.8965 type:complete len:378 (-) Transcript_4604:339-1472(-)
MMEIVEVDANSSVPTAECDESGTDTDSYAEKYGKAAAAASQRRISILKIFLCGAAALGTISYFRSGEVTSIVTSKFAAKNDVNANPADSGAKARKFAEQKAKADRLHKERQDKAKVRKAEELLLSKRVQELDVEVRGIKSTLPAGKFMETDPAALAATRQLQAATRRLLHARYGPDFDDPGGDARAGTHYRIKFDLLFPPTMPDFESEGAEGSFVVEMAPASLIPHSVFTFLEVARTFERSKAGGRLPTAFHRNAGHVLQAKVETPVRHLAFQEYDPKFPHKKYTLGYAGRPSGPAFYVSIQDNSRNHGPGSQQQANPNEADGLFGRVISGFEVVDRIHKMPGREFINDKNKIVGITEMTIMVPTSMEGNYVVWTEN